MFVLAELCMLLGANLPQLKLQASFIPNSGDSLAATALAAVCKIQGCELAYESILTSCTLWNSLYAVCEFETVDNAFSFSFRQKQRSKKFMSVSYQTSRIMFFHGFNNCRTQLLASNLSGTRMVISTLEIFFLMTKTSSG